jgi:hypothetical protein
MPYYPSFVSCQLPKALVRYKVNERYFHPYPKLGSLHLLSGVGLVEGRVRLSRWSMIRGKIVLGKGKFS